MVWLLAPARKVCVFLETAALLGFSHKIVCRVEQRNKAREKNNPGSEGSEGRNTLLKRVRGEWPKSFELKGNLQSFK